MGKTIGIGAQHVVSMFGATFVFPLVMGLDASLAIMFSGICTILFLLVTKNKVPSYLGTSASFVAGVAAIRAQGGDSADVTGAILVGGLVLAALGVLVHFAGGAIIHKILPPAVTGAVVMLIGFNLAPVVAGIYWPQDQWIALITAAFMVFAAVVLPGFWSRIAVFLALVFGYLLSFFADKIFGPITSVLPTGPDPVEHDRVSWAGVQAADWIGLPSGTLADGVSVVHGPSFSLTFILLVLPGVIALVAENTGHVKAVAEMTGEDLDPYMGRAIGADGIATAFASAFGGSPTTTYAENIGVMSATRVYSTAAYYVAAAVAILLGLCPKFGAIVNATPGGVLGGITVVLYGMIGLIGAKIWVENNIDFGNPVNLVGLSAGLIAGIGGVTLKITDDFELGGIALGTILVILFFHMVRGRGVFAPARSPATSATPTTTVAWTTSRPVEVRRTDETGTLRLRPPEFARRGPRGPRGADGGEGAGRGPVPWSRSCRCGWPHRPRSSTSTHCRPGPRPGGPRRGPGQCAGAARRGARLDRGAESQPSSPPRSRTSPMRPSATAAPPSARSCTPTPRPRCRWSCPCWTGPSTSHRSAVGAPSRPPTCSPDRWSRRWRTTRSPSRRSSRRSRPAAESRTTRSPVATVTTRSWGVGALVHTEGETVTRARVGYVSVSDVPVVVDVTDALDDPATLALAELDPADDIHASADYRAQLIRVLTPRVLSAAIDHARSRGNE